MPFNQDWLDGQLKNPVHRIIGESRPRQVSPCCQAAIVNAPFGAAHRWVCLACGKPVPDSASPVGGIPPVAQVATGGAAVKRRTGPKPPNEVEQRYYDDCIAGHWTCPATYEGLSFKLAGGAYYKPDWVLWDGNKVMECVEVKAEMRTRTGKIFKHGSHGRSRLAFQEARAQYPAIRWTWAVWRKGKWVLE